MHAFAVILACLATAAMAAPTPAPIRDQLAAPRVHPREAEAEAPKTNEKVSQALYDNGYAPRLPW
ncbi:hypothetical protein QQS21_008443 [Conoideocrella luteorostrata]|uniref:Uncharacterized protein n=1 Tax=Conoideocrella luteorostrata TaxID=1105319 RepID=A0AAJ0CIX1_9HYPO|nr:hypothetical protein QQS21_008443 [Conoideocrella luteorostrata]